MKITVQHREQGSRGAKDWQTPWRTHAHPGVSAWVWQGTLRLHSHVDRKATKSHTSLGAFWAGELLLWLGRSWRLLVSVHPSVLIRSGSTFGWEEEPC